MTSEITPQQVVRAAAEFLESEFGSVTVVDDTGPDESVGFVVTQFPSGQQFILRAVER